MPRLTLPGVLALSAIAVTVSPLTAVGKLVWVTPHAVFMNEQNRSAEVTLGPSGDDPEEVTVELQFGFPDTDSSGTPFIRFIEDPGVEFPSSATWIRPFPRRMRLEPGEQQVVRLLATPPEALPDGEYWTRMIITSRGLKAPLASRDTTVRAGVDLVIRLITSVTYRKGDVQTGVELRALQAVAEGDSLVAWMRAARRGNGAYLGTARFELLDQAGRQVREWPVPIAVYYPINRRFVFPRESLPSGTYRLRLRLVAERSDLLAGQVLPAPSVTDSVELRVP